MKLSLLAAGALALAGLAACAATPVTPASGSAPPAASSPALSPGQIVLGGVLTVDTALDVSETAHAAGNLAPANWAKVKADAPLALLGVQTAVSAYCAVGGSTAASVSAAVTTAIADLEQLAKPPVAAASVASGASPTSAAPTTAAEVAAYLPYVLDGLVDVEEVQQAAGLTQAQLCAPTGGLTNAVSQLQNDAARIAGE